MAISTSSSTMSHIYIVLSALICLSVGYDDLRNAKILDSQLQLGHSGNFFFRFESSDGTTREEEGTVLDKNVENSPIVVKGSYSYADETGKVYTVRYIADQNGFRPEGDHIRVPTYVVDPDPVNIAVRSTSYPAPPLLVEKNSQPQFISSRTEVPTEPLREQISIDSTVPADQKLQSSIVNILSNGYGRAFSLEQ